MKRQIILPLIALWVLGVAGTLAASENEPFVAQSQITVQPVLLQRGRAELQGEIRGDAYVDYRLTLRAGQVLAVNLKASNRQNYFNVLPQGAETAMFVGSTSGNRFSRAIPVDGEYTLRVYLMRAAARRDESSRFHLQVSVSGKALPPLAAGSDALIPGTPFHAAATVACGLSRAETHQHCDAFVIRRGIDGTATVQIRWKEYGLDVVRHILFVKGKAVSSDSPDVLKSRRRGDTLLLDIGTDERFDFPDALITGG